MNIKKLRINYKNGKIDFTNLVDSPISLFLHWFDDALSVYLLSEKINPESNFGFQKAQLYSNLGKVDLMIKEYLNELSRNKKQKQIVISQIQRFLDNDGIKSDINYKLVALV